MCPVTFGESLINKGDIMSDHKVVAAFQSEHSKCEVMKSQRWGKIRSGTMKRMLRNIGLFAGLCALLSGLPSATASIVQSNSTSSASQTQFPCSTVDLINNGQATLSSRVDANYVSFNGSSTATLNDGALGAASTVTTVAMDLDGTWLSTFYLNTNTAMSGYTITNISTYCGWIGDRACQKYELFLSFAGSENFVSYGTYSVTASGSSMIQLTATSGIIAMNVAAIRFSFLMPDNGSAPTYREVDVFGYPTTSQPSGTLFRFR